MSTSDPEYKLIENLKKIISDQLGSPISNRKLGELLLSPNRFNRILRENTILRNISIDKIELNLKHLLNRERLKDAFEILEIYRSERNMKLFQEESSLEFQLAKKIQKIFLDYNGKLLSFSRLGEIFGYKALFNENINKKFKIRKFTLEKIRKKVESILIEPFISRMNNLIDNYCIQVGYFEKKLIKNKAEDALIKILKNCYSDEYIEQISNNNLSQKFGSRLLFNDTLKKGTKFIKLTIERITYVWWSLQTYPKIKKK